MDGAYNGMKLSCANQAILSENGVDKSSGYSVPLEIMPAGQFEPLYKTTLSVQVCFCFISSHILQHMTDIYHPVLICFLMYLSFGRMENCQFCLYLFMEQLLWLITKTPRSIHHLISFSSISMINEM
jgi:hypothetical protein